jgi:hypothetical protein
MQLSTVHVYLTYPFVLSWSLLEAMSMGCCIVAGDTKPLHETIEHGKTGMLGEHFQHPGRQRGNQMAASSVSINRIQKVDKQASWNTPRQGN